MEDIGFGKEKPPLAPSEQSRPQSENGCSAGTDAAPAPSDSCRGEIQRSEDSQEVVLPEKRWRVVVLLAAGAAFLGGAVGVGGLGYQIARLDRLQEDQLREAIGRLEWSAVGITCLGAVGFLGAALWLFRLGWKINRSGRYPPPGMRVLWKTRIRRGPPALLPANFALLGAVLLAAVGTLGMIWLYQQAIETLRAFFLAGQ